MPVFDFTSPEGKTYSVTGPDGATPEQAFAMLQQHLGGATQPPAPTPEPVTTNQLVRSAAEGIPIAGGAIKYLNAATNATLAPIVDPLLPDSYDKLKEPTWGERFSHALKSQEQQTAQFEKEHPVASTAAGLAGGIGATGLVASAPLGARLLGLGSRTLPASIAQGAASGAAINAADAAVRGNDPGVAAITGGAFGALAPVVGRGAELAARPIVNAVRGIVNPGNEAARRVASAIGRDVRAGTAGMTEQEFLAARASGQPVNVMDLGGETTRGLARSAANTSPEGRAALDQSINDRFEGQANRLSDWLRTTFHFPDAVAQQSAIEQTARTSNRAAYRQAYSEGSGGLWSPELERMAGSGAVGSAMRKAAESAGDEAIVSGYGAMNPRITFTDDGRMQFARGPNGVPTYPDLQYWDLVRRELSDAARRAGPGTSEARRLGNFASSLNAELDRLVPSYAQARASAASFFGAEDALQAGRNFLNGRAQNNEARVQISRMSPQERQLFQDGFVHQLIENIRETPDRRSAITKYFSSPGARERLNVVMGPQRARELESFVNVEGIMDRARTAVQGNSTTARQLFELGLAGGIGGLGGVGVYNQDPQQLMLAALAFGARRGGHAIDQRVARQVAGLLASNDSNRVRAGMLLLANNRPLFGALRNASDAFSSIAARGSAPTITQ